MELRLRKKLDEYTTGNAIPPCNMQKVAVEEYAESVAAEYGFRSGADPLELARQLGGRIHLQEITDWIDGESSGSIYVHDRFDFDICLPTYTSPLRDRFTVGHELGHYFLHSEQGARAIIAFRNGSTRIEWDANWFYAALLMPRSEFDSLANRGISDASLANHFGVSQDAVRVRRKSRRV